LSSGEEDEPEVLLPLKERREPGFRKRDEAAFEAGLDRIRQERGETASTTARAAPTPVVTPAESGPGVAAREEVLDACFTTTAFLSAIAVVLRKASHEGALEEWFDAQVPDIQALVPLPGMEIVAAGESYKLVVSTPTAEHLGLGLAVAGAVTLARVLLLKAWPAFKRDSDAANSSVLPNLEVGDLLIVAFLPAMSEELMFRDLLLPAVGLDWTGVGVAAGVFGILHVSGGRGLPFAAWATLVGAAYGALVLYTKDGSAPVVAHGVANLISAGIYRYEHPPGERSAAPLPSADEAK